MTVPMVAWMRIFRAWGTSSGGRIWGRPARKDPRGPPHKRAAASDETGLPSCSKLGMQTQRRRGAVSLVRYRPSEAGGKIKKWQPSWEPHPPDRRGVSYRRLTPVNDRFRATVGAAQWRLRTVVGCPRKRWDLV
jgi:hypothetical protein